MAKDLFSSHPPFTPPTSEEDRLSWLRLIRSPRVGPTTFHRLMSEHKSAEAALDALPEIARSAGADHYAPCPKEAAEAEIDLARAKGARMLCLGTEAYPSTLASISDAPPVLWCMGHRAPILRPMVALVGARNASSLGTRMARTLAEGLGHEGYTIVSGLARGVDAAAHHASLKTGTIAVMGGGVDVIYPTENAVLAAAIADQGLRMSEQPMGLHPQARHFPPRNRIISGLALAVVVVEAAEKSGTLITVRDALDQGREVMAVPGHPVDGRAGGCNRLIREGATLVRHVEDVLEVLRRLQSAKTEAPEPEQNSLPLAAPPDPDSQSLHQRILDLLGPSPVAEDLLIRDLKLSAAAISPALVLLEMQGSVRRHPGGLVSRA
ncbi:DNA-processing protein DprA [Roseinatronobacter bogoriensis]|uniref:DNA-protecting protein DprA n=1 Tax=Roseinatronobacter bogoriensis subsp. barguzinensis TaxID=441209 RepID=A0A2K8KBL4_9RHOB|nr:MULTISPECIES: DNA-processing protein DprA [Rhodobaca]ATX66817.1 DNA-protecting protein DprA [Rhodobaca barguzinensis]TDW41026.1 DNA processing protein [Rhodobaca barguzinensis]TDY74796.1 DNA processing protein [Rhodobaca bogoriensis DSM 18756]